MPSAVILLILIVAQEEGDPESLPPPVLREKPDPVRPGPLGVRGHSLFQIATIDFTPDAPFGMPEGAVELHASLTWLNIFNYDPGDFAIDGEFARASATLWYGLSDDWQVGLTVPIEYVGGGLMDTFIEGFHDFLGLSQGGREEFEEGRFQIGKADPPGSLQWEDSDSGVHLGDVTLSVRHQWSSRLSIGFKLKFPTSAPNDFYESHSMGVGVDANLVVPVDDWLFYFGFSAAMVGNIEVLGERLEPFQMSFLAAVERVIAEDLSIVAQVLAQSPIARDFHEFSDWSSEVSLGLKVRILDGVTLQVALIENLFRFDNSADFGIHAGFVLRL